MQLIATLIVSCATGLFATPQAVPGATVAPPPALRTFTPPPAKIEVIELGNEPRRSLRPLREPGRDEEIQLVVEPLLNRFVDGDLRVNEKPVPIRVDLAVRTREVLSDGAARLEIVVRDAQPTFTTANDAAQSATITSALDGLRGGTLQVDLDPRGAVTEVRVPAARWPDDDRTTTVERIVRAVTQLFVPTPDVALGLGGRWRVLFDDRQAPIARREMLVLRITMLDEATADCERYAIWSELRRSQRMPEDAVPGAPDAVLTHLSGRGGGTMTLARDRAAATSLDDQVFVKLFGEGRDPRDNAMRQLHEQTMVKTEARSRVAP